MKQRERHFTYLYIEYEGKIAIHQRGAGDIWQGLWEFPQEEQLASSEDSTWKTEAQLLQKGVKHILTPSDCFLQTSTLAAYKASTTAL